MAWQVEILPAARAQIAGLDKPVQKRVVEFLEKLERANDPFALLLPMRYALTGCWKKRIGDYRIVIEPERSRLVLMVVKAGHRSKVYR